MPGLARPTARRLLLTLQELGFVRSTESGFVLTPKVLTLGMAYVSALGLWDIARPHMEDLVGRTGESSSMAQLDGSDIVYVARVSVPKIIALRVEIGTRFPAPQTSQGKVLLAALRPGRPRRDARRTEPGRPAPLHRLQTSDQLREVSSPGSAPAGGRSPTRSSRPAYAPWPRRCATGRDAVRAAMNVTVHAAETTTDHLLGHHLPLLLRAAGDVSAEWALWQSRPHSEVEVDSSTA